MVIQLVANLAHLHGDTRVGTAEVTLFYTLRRLTFVLLRVPNLTPSPRRHSISVKPGSKGLTHLNLFYTLGGDPKSA
jgi:hypothetical protein